MTTFESAADSRGFSIRITYTTSGASITNIGYELHVTGNNFTQWTCNTKLEIINSSSVVVATLHSPADKKYDMGTKNSYYTIATGKSFTATTSGNYRVRAVFDANTDAAYVPNNTTATTASQALTVAPATFVVTYSNANGANGTTTETVTSGGKGTFPAPGARTGYSFDGWYDAATTLYYAAGVATPAITGTKTFTSSWTAASYYISYDKNGGSGTMANTTWSYPNSGKVAANAFTRANYTFSGWTNSSGNSVAVGAEYTTSVALTANWLGDAGTVTYNGNGNTGGSTANTTWNYPNTGTVRANGFTKTGYAFARWNTAADGSGTDYFPNGTAPANGTTLYAIWGILAVYPSFTDTTVLSPATMGTAYSDGVSASNASSYSIISGAIPTGLSFNTSTGAITGTPTAQGEFTFSARATSSTANTVDSGNITIVVYPPGKRPDTNTRLTTAKRLSGSTWVNLTVMKRFDGSNWVNITNT